MQAEREQFVRASRKPVAVYQNQTLDVAALGAGAAELAYPSSELNGPGIPGGGEGAPAVPGFSNSSFEPVFVQDNAIPVAFSTDALRDMFAADRVR
jgi:hypothetical protein